jgi:hypothetical protein
LVVLLTLAVAGCAGDLNEDCGNDVGCKTGLYCQDELGGEGFWSDQQPTRPGACEPYYDLFPMEGVCKPTLTLGDPCDGFTRECGDYYCVHHRCVLDLPVCFRIGG